MQQGPQTSDDNQSIVTYESGYPTTSPKNDEESRIVFEDSNNMISNDSSRVIIEDSNNETNSQPRVGAIFVAGLSPPAVEQGEESIGEDPVLNAASHVSEPGTPEHRNLPETAMAYAVDHNDSEEAEEAVLIVKDLSLCIALVSHRWLKILVILSFIAVGVSVTISVLVKPGSSQQDIDVPQDPLQKKNTRDDLFVSVAKELSGEEILVDPNSAQSKALQWLTSVDRATIPFGDNDRARQRYAAAVLYFSTGGSTTWSQQNDFLNTESHECDWNTIEIETGRKKGIECLHAFNTDITQLNLSKMNMTGTIPKEISSLERLVILDFSENKNMTGTIPNIFRGLARLQTIYLNDMDLSGTIPNDITTLEFLTSVHLYGNERLQQIFEPLCVNNSGYFVEVNCVEPTRKPCSCCTCFHDSEDL